ncbi:hypothetical protein J7384_02460 [Endozoicomonas sp. G2_1]|uniref:hypothetical protein n=1 Tax=Endozoicomonas sp. G2_1 TaxID=2821091 RepID=UPI001ADC1B04|nr:hypothetical protein [Endozoicomonas sp. G2_1]MBO9489217.1 hypothetical protein [Endozoicomonas sp. G2_1]
MGNAKNLPSNATIANKNIPLTEQIDDWPDIVHFHRPYNGGLHVPYISTEHGNATLPTTYSRNCVFLSRKHAENHGADCYVYNGLNWDEYGEPNIAKPDDYFTFLGKAKAPTKNLSGTIHITRKAQSTLRVICGNRLSINQKQS